MPETNFKTDVDRRKIEAYDAARAVVKTEGESRAFYVLRAEAAEERLQEAHEVIEGLRRYGCDWIVELFTVRLQEVERALREKDEIVAAAREYVGAKAIALARQNLAGDSLVGVLADKKWRRLVFALAAAAAPSGPDEQTETEGTRWYVHCGCDYHGDHGGCKKDCQDNLGCTHELGVIMTALDPDEPGAAPSGEPPSEQEQGPGGFSVGDERDLFESTIEACITSFEKLSDSALRRADVLREVLRDPEASSEKVPVSGERDAGPQLPEFTPDCLDGSCLTCHACYSRYVELKMAGALDGADAVPQPPETT